MIRSVVLMEAAEPKAARKLQEDERQRDDTNAVTAYPIAARNQKGGMLKGAVSCHHCVWGL